MAVVMRACDIDMSGKVWLYRPARHKTEHHGHGRIIALGPKAQEVIRPFLTLERAVHRITGELADWYGLDAGHLRVGDRADAVVIDPRHLDASLDAYAEHPAPFFGGLSRMVNRNDDTVAAVFVGGTYVFGNGRAAPALGKQRTGEFLRAG